MSHKKINLAIIEGNGLLAQGIWEYLRIFGVFELAGSASDGALGMELLKNAKIDVFLLDIDLPQRNGINLPEALADDPLPNQPICIVLASKNDDKTREQASRLNAAGTIMKPFDLDVLAQRIIDAYNEGKNPEACIEALPQSDEGDDSGAIFYVTELLQDCFGIRNNLRGYSYIKTAVLMAIENAVLMDSVTKQLYPAVAKAHQTTPANVERAVRHALGVPQQGDINMTNSQFIKFMVEQYHLNNL